jgi:hypothetical protein
MKTITKALPSGHEHYKICIMYRHKEYCCITNDMPNIDKYKSNERGSLLAGNILYNEVKRKNDLK